MQVPPKCSNPHLPFSDLSLQSQTGPHKLFFLFSLFLLVINSENVSSFIQGYICL